MGDLQQDCSADRPALVLASQHDVNKLKNNEKRLLLCCKIYKFTWGDLQPNCSADRPVTGPRQTT
eukprot:1161345-Pelagomonas_calceolata.AAC.1